MYEIITAACVIIIIVLLYVAKKRKSIRSNFQTIKRKSKYETSGEIKFARNSFNTETANEFTAEMPRENLDDEYKAEETYCVKDVPYKENNEFESDAYIEKTVNNELSSLEKGIVFAEILGKPVGLRRKI